MVPVQAQLLLRRGKVFKHHLCRKIIMALWNWVQKRILVAQCYAAFFRAPGGMGSYRLKVG